MTDLPTTAFATAVMETNPVSAENLAPLAQQAMTSQPPTFQPVIDTDAIERARQQEKDKLYPQISELKDEVQALRKEKADREAAEAAARAEAEAEARRRAEEEMDVRELLRQKEQEWENRLNEERSERERALATLDVERRFQELQEYRSARLNAERDNIMPELIDLVTGNSPEEIEDSINSLKDRTARILESAQQAMSSARRDMVGTRTTIPASGPLDTNSERQFSPEDIKQMSLSDYQKYRDRLLGNATSDRGRGLFG